MPEIGVGLDSGGRAKPRARNLYHFALKTPDFSPYIADFSLKNEDIAFSNGIEELIPR